MMAKILMLYSNDLSPSDLEKKPIAGTQTAFVELSRAFAKLGHQVCVLTRTSELLDTESYKWLHLDEANTNGEFDLMIVNVSIALFNQFKHVKAKRKVLWIHNEAKYLIYWSRLRNLILFRPIIVFSGEYHASTLPFFIPTGRRVIIPYGLSEQILISERQAQLTPAPKVFFTSNPLRSLRWLVDLWVEHINPVIPEAELHIFSSWKTYGKWGESVKERMKQEMDYVSGFSNAKVIIRDVLPKLDLFNEMLNGRAIFYKGDKAETFCLAVAEAQALGLPAVVTDLGSMKERVIHGITGYVAQSDKDFIRFVKEILTNDGLWKTMSLKSRVMGKSFTWQRAAEKFLQIIEG
jgi:glycosyltransferase involved in cell wall biosynthesis